MVGVFGKEKTGARHIDLEINGHDEKEKATARLVRWKCSDTGGMHDLEEAPSVALIMFWVSPKTI